METAAATRIRYQHEWLGGSYISPGDNDFFIYTTVDLFSIIFHGGSADQPLP